MGREKWDRHEKICQSLFSLSSSRERSELSTLLLGSYKQPTTHNQQRFSDGTDTKRFVSPYFRFRLLVSEANSRRSFSALTNNPQRKKRGKNGDRLHFRREEPSLRRAGRGERRERERERRERERVGREKWDRHEKICQSLFSLSSSRERSELSTLFLGS